MAGTAAQIIEGWRKDGVRWVRFEAPDMHGTSRSKMVPIEDARGYVKEGLNMYGGAGVLDTASHVVGGTLYGEETGYADMRIVPDPATAAIVPWLEVPTGRFICDAFRDGEPLEAMPRQVFARVLERCRSHGFEPLIGFEPEYYLLDADKGRLFEGVHIFNTVRNTYVPFLQILVDQLRAFGIDVITHNSEYSGSQFESPFAPGAGMAGPGHLLHVQELGQGARAPARLRRHVHGQAVLGSRRLRQPHARQPPRCRGEERVRRQERRARHLADLPSLHRRKPRVRPRRVHAARPHRELPQATPGSHVQPDERLLGARGPIGARSRQGRLDRVTTRGAARPELARESLPRSGRGPCSGPPRHRAGARARAAGHAARRGGGRAHAAPGGDARGARGARDDARRSGRRSARTSSSRTRRCVATSSSASTTT